MLSLPSFQLPLPHRVQLRPLSSDPRPLPAFRFRTPTFAILCSVSRLGGEATVDYERKNVLKWIDLYRRVSLMEDPSLDAATVLEQWEEEQRKLTKWEATRVAKELRKFRRFKLALDVYDWIAARKERYKFHASDAAILLDLMAKVKGISSADEYFLALPESLKDKRTYCALLNAYAHAKQRGKSEEIFQIMQSKGYVTDALVFNVMMTLYMNTEKPEKVIAIITEMQQEKIKLDTYSYNIWITTCATMGNLEEMEKVLELMKLDEGVEANWSTYSTLSSMNIKHGKIDKAEMHLKEAEARVTGRDRTSFNYLLGLYGLLGKKEEVHRIWKWYKSCFPEILNKGYHSMLSALVKVGDVEGAEVLYEEWLSSTSRYDPKVCNILVTHFAKIGMMEKAEDCLERMLSKGGTPNPITWEFLAEGYIAKKQTSKALSYLKEAASIRKPLMKKWRPRPSNVANFLAVCKELEDTSSAEALMDIMQELGYLEDGEYKALISANSLQDNV